MKAAVIREAGQSPVYEEFPGPVAEAGESLVSMRAAALSPLTRGRASGTHYSSSGDFPFVAGVDGVGTTPDGRRVYVVLPRAPYGAMAEQTVVSAAQILPVPDGLADVTAAAIANPGMSSWAALRERARLVAGETVLVNGATGASGRLAVQIAKHLGAGRVIATGRDAAALDALRSLGADDVVRLDDDATALGRRFEGHFATGVDVVVDYLWGASARSLLVAAAKAAPALRPVRVVQVGTASGAEIALPGAVLRSSSIVLMGSGIGSVSLERLLAAIGGVFEAAAAGTLRMDATAVPLSEVAAAWSRAGERIVFTLATSAT